MKHTLTHLEAPLRKFLTGYAERFFLAFMLAAVPRSKALTSERLRQSLDLVDHMIGGKPKGIQRKLIVFFVLIELVSLIKKGRRFTALAPADTKDVLQFFYDSPVTLFRKGFWGLNTLAKLGVYGDPQVYPDIQYRLKATQS